MVDPPVGAASNRDLLSDDAWESGERGERDIDVFIERHDRARRRDEGEADAAQISADEWLRSCEQHAAEHREAMRFRWAAFHKRAAERHKATLAALVEYHEAEARRYAEGA